MDFLFRVRADVSDAYNNHIYWNIYDFPFANYDYCKVSFFELKSRGVLFAEVFSIPEECTLIRVSHDPYFEIEK